MPPTDSTHRPPYGWASLAGLLVFALYAVTLAPTTAFWDTSEYIATAHILGIPHPPGNPLFVVLARAWELLLAPTGLSVAARVNLFSAAMSAGAHGLWFLVVHRILAEFSDDRRFRLVGAAAAVLVSATAFTVWNQSNVNEKVYTVSLFTIALLTWLAFVWRDNIGRGKDDNLLVLMLFILALSVGNHLMAFLAAPALAVFVVAVHPATLGNWRLYAWGALAVLTGLSIHLFLPIRAGLDPVINEADPTCPGIRSALASIVTWGQAGCAELSDALARKQYDKPPLIPRQAPLASQYQNYLQYFDWQWARTLGGIDTTFAFARIPFTVLFASLGIFGAMEHLRRARTSFWYVATLFATLSVGLVFYLNFKYGYTLPDPFGDRTLHEVRERDYFFIGSFSVWGLWAGIGIVALWQTLKEEVTGRWSTAAPVLGLALLPLILNWGWASRAGDYAARDWAYNLLQSTEPYSILFTNGDNDTFPLWYLQEVEGIRRDVTVIVTSYLNTPWYAKQLRDLTTPCPTADAWAEDPTRIICQRAYRPEGTGIEYTADPAGATEPTTIELDAPPAPPTTSILPIEDSLVDRIAREGWVPLSEPIAFDLGPVQAVLRPEWLRKATMIPWHHFAIVLIRESIDERPIYFASSGSAADELGLSRYLVRRGLAFKLLPGPPGEVGGEGVVPVERTTLSMVTGDFVDLPVTRTLLEEGFVHRGGIPDDWEFWPDVSTLGIPNYYAWAYYTLLSAVAEVPEDRVQEWQARADAWTLLGR